MGVEAWRPVESTVASISIIMPFHLAWSWGLGPDVLDSLWMLDAQVARVCVCSQVLAKKGASSPGIPLSRLAFSHFSPISDNLPVADPPTYKFAA